MLAEKTRWRVAHAMDRLRGQCWSELVEYALGTRRWPWARQDDVCRRDAARCGACYCGKIRTVAR